MAIDKHPSRDATKPVVLGPDTRTTSGNKGTKVLSGSGQAGTAYGARHEIQAKDPNRSEMKHHFEDFVGVAKSMPDAGSPKPGKQTTNPAKTFGKIKE